MGVEPAEVGRAVGVVPGAACRGAELVVDLLVEEDTQGELADDADDQADDPGTAYQPTRTDARIDRIGSLVGIERSRR